MEQVVNNATIEFSEKVIKEEKNSIYEFLFGAFLFFSVGTAMYFRDSGTKFWCEFLGLFIIVCIYLYARTLRKANIISSTINKYEINEEYFIFNTSRFNLFLIFELGNLKYTIKKNHLNMCKSYYPLAKLFDINERVFKIAIDNKEFFILSQYFDMLPESFNSLTWREVNSIEILKNEGHDS